LGVVAVATSLDFAVKPHARYPQTLRDCG